MKTIRPSELELQVLAVLWERGPSSVRAVQEALPDGKDRAYTTVLSVMQVMEKKGLIGHSQQGQANVYHTLVKRGQVLRPMMRELIRNVFGGSPARCRPISARRLEARRRRAGADPAGDPGRGAKGASGEEKS